MESGNRSPWMDPDTEARLLKSARRGDRAAYLKLVSWYMRPLYRLAFALCQERNEALDMTKESFLRAWKGLKLAPEGQPFYPAISRITRNLSIALLRRRGGALPAHIPDGREKRLLEAFSRLSADEQVVLALRLVERLSYPEIETLLQASAGTVLSRLSSARAHIRSRERPWEDAA